MRQNPRASAQVGGAPFGPPLAVRTHSSQSTHVLATSGCFGRPQNRRQGSLALWRDGWAQVRPSSTSLSALDKSPECSSQHLDCCWSYQPGRRRTGAAPAMCRVADSRFCFVRPRLGPASSPPAPRTLLAGFRKVYKDYLSGTVAHLATWTCAQVARAKVGATQRTGQEALPRSPDACPALDVASQVPQTHCCAT